MWHFEGQDLPIVWINNFSNLASFDVRAFIEKISLQNEIIKLILKGFSTQEIADRLNVSVNTIKNHKQVLFRKVNVKSSVELINFATRK